MHAKLRVLAVAVTLLGPASVSRLYAQSAPSSRGAAPRPSQRGGTPQDVQPSSNNQAISPRGRGEPEPVAQPADRSPVRQAQNTSPPARAVIKGVAPRAPFALTPAEQQLLDQILVKWEKQSDKVRTFKCNFGWWVVNKQFGPPQNNYVHSEGRGYIKFKAPDQGTYRVTELTVWDDKKKAYAPQTDGLDHWVCDGKSIFQFDAQKRQLIERQLAPQLQGKAISDGPLPFVFGAKVDQLNRRYWMRDVTPKQEIGKKIWLEAWPKYQQDAANFEHALVVLNQNDFMPSALRVFQLGGKDNDKN